MPNQAPFTEIHIHDLSHDGRGVGRLTDSNSPSSGKTCFISGALPGEQVRWKRTNSKRSFDEGELVEVLKASKERVEPLCKYYKECGGCQLQHFEPSAQLSWKEKQLIKTVDKAGLKPQSWLKPLSRDVWNYRRRARLAVSYKSKVGVQIGFRTKGSHNLVAIDECLVLDKRLNDLIVDLQPLSIALRKYGLTQFELSAADNQLAICCYVKKPFDLEALDSVPQLQELQPKAQVWLRLPGQDAQAVYKEAVHKGPVYKGTAHKELGSENSTALKTQLTDRTQMAFEPSQFVQVNGAMNRAMIHQALQLCQPDTNSRVLDLFCGAGNFSLVFAEQSEHVQGVEGSAALCRQATNNAQAMGYDNLDFQVMDLDKPANFSRIQAKDVNMVILDPPRAGAANLAPWLNSLGAEKILYVSCHPATMVRDLQILGEKYQIDSMGVMDMFPHTSHLEAMCLLTKS